MRRIIENIRFGLFFLLLWVILAAALFWALSIGTVHLSLPQIFSAILEQLESGRAIEAPGQGPVQILFGCSGFHGFYWLLS